MLKAIAKFFVAFVLRILLLAGAIFLTLQSLWAFGFLGATLVGMTCVGAMVYMILRHETRNG